ncbi:uncharacterized protein N0V89_004995 [Didymosphaeria variabile]|uniref:Cytochrome P450 n=1 Tax=Didymosphaeria variabile TaxID=1932322 RepID=A0A9W8XM05_9PLEO|nr:uncharacterized protein N0V89_004995 [Didymosphaeria variabile]KAJ4353268.1 hypothetical protein N0V89_004995 [Didymosphaeria variabile]
MLAVTLVVASLVTYLLYSLWRLVYNVYFHPLAKFPGPWWAGATSYAEAYFDIIKGGLYFAEVEAMHAHYGPIVRITPTELSIRDAEFYEHIYGSMNARRDIDIAFARLTVAPTSVISTLKHDHHRARRIPLLSFFSKQAITRLEPFISSRVNLLVKKLKHAHEVGRVIEAVDAYGALTTDVISYYAYGETFDFLGRDTDLEFRNDYMHAISGLAFASPMLLHFPLVADCMRRLPEWILTKINPGMMRVNDLRRWCSANANKVLQAASSGVKRDTVKPNTIFEALLSDDLPPEEKTLERMTDEGFVITGAGLETTSRYLTNITTHLLLNPDCLARLRAELKVAMPSPGDLPPSIVLENLPYLASIVHVVTSESRLTLIAKAAVVNEGLRHETIFSNRFTRQIVEPLPYKNFVIPAGTNIGCAPYLQNHNADVFPEPERFRPERWIEARERGVNLPKYLATFVKGGRMCLGIK